MPLFPISSSSGGVPAGYVQTAYGIVPISALTNTQVTPKSEGDTTQTDNAGGNTGGGGGSNSNTNTNVGSNDTYEFTTALGNMLNRPYQDPFYSMQYGQYGAQYPNIGAQIGAALYSNIQPRQYTPNWAVKNLPPRLQGGGYLQGGNMGNYGQWFSKFGPREVGNPYPINGYDPATSLNVRPGFNPFLRNQAGSPSIGMTGAGGLPGSGLQSPGGGAPPPPAGPTNNPLGAGGGAPPPSGGLSGPQPGSVPGPGGVYIDPTDPNGVINLPQSAGQSLQSIMSYVQSNPQLRGLLGL